MARVYGAISVTALLLAIGLVLYGWRPPEAGSLARALGAPAPRPAGPCSGLLLTGGHADCFQPIQIVCRTAGPDGPMIVAQGVYSTGRPGSVQITPNQVAIALQQTGGNIVLTGGPPQSFDPSMGARVDTAVGLANTPDYSNVKGLISCGF